MLSFQTLLASPALVGIIFIIAGVVARRFPPRQINYIYGYRSRKSMSSQANWDLANSYYTGIMIRAGVAMMGLGLILSLFSDNIQFLSIFTVLSGVAGGLIIFLLTEKKLK